MVIFMPLRRLSALICRSLILAALMVISSSAARSQTVDLLALADSLYSAGNHHAAVTEYKRYMFFNSSGISNAAIYRRLGLCYRDVGDWDNAINSFRESINRQEDDSLRAECSIDLAIACIASGNYSAAEMALVRLSAFGAQPNLRSRASFFLAVNNVYRHKWDAVGKFLRQSSPLSCPGEDSALCALLDKAAALKYKSPSKAKWLSTFLPGSGQVYAGEPLRGLNALSVNGLFAYVLYWSATTHHDALEMANYILWFHRYWSGNRNHAAEYAQENNAAKNEKMQQELLSAINEWLR
jgi:Tetratricopeptide repeat